MGVYFGSANLDVENGVCVCVVVCEILQGEWASFRVRTLIGCEKHVLETTALLWVVWLYVCFVLFVGLGGARRFLLQEMPARLRFLLQIAETRA